MMSYTYIEFTTHTIKYRTNSLLGRLSLNNLCTHLEISPNYRTPLT
jgi:hypothetical protein